VVRASPIRRNFQTLHANHLLGSSLADISSRRLLSLLSAPLRVRFQRERSLAAIVHSGPHGMFPSRVGEPKTPSSRKRLVIGIPKLVNVFAAREIDDAVGSCPTSLGLDVGRLFDGSFGSIRWCDMVNPNWALRGCDTTRLPRKERTERTRERPCSAIILPLRWFSQRSSWAIEPRWSATRCDPNALPRSSAHRDTAFVGRALGRDLARGFRFGRDAALVAQT
jgi:hypothetical protein